MTLEINDNNLKPIGTEFYIGTTKYRVVSYITCYDSTTDIWILQEELIIIFQG